MPHIDLGSIARLNQATSISKKPPHLISLYDQDRNKLLYFISLDKPELLIGFIQVKGCFCTKKLAYLEENFANILASTSKEEYQEIIFPNERVYEIKNLQFNAVKTITPIITGKEE